MGDFDCPVMTNKKYKVIKADVDISSDVVFLDCYNTIVEGSFYCSGSNIKSLDGCPVIVRGYFSCSHTNVASLEGCPRNVYHHFYCRENLVTNLKNIHKQVDRIGEMLFISGGIKSHILGVLKIRDLAGIIMEEVGYPKLALAVHILNNHLKNKPNPNDRNIHHAQEQLIEAGLKEFAQL